VQVGKGERKFDHKKQPDDFEQLGQYLFGFIQPISASQNEMSFVRFRFVRMLF
jgi:hypothetical protein